MAKSNMNKDENKPMFFSAYNYKMIGIAVGLIFAGFAAMLFENEIDGFVSLYISPIVVTAGFILVIFAVLKHDNSNTGLPDAK